MKEKKKIGNNSLSGIKSVEIALAVKEGVVSERKEKIRLMLDRYREIEDTIKFETELRKELRYFVAEALYMQRHPKYHFQMEWLTRIEELWRPIKTFVESRYSRLVPVCLFDLYSFYESLHSVYNSFRMDWQERFYARFTAQHGYVEKICVAQGREVKDGDW